MFQVRTGIRAIPLFMGARRLWLMSLSLTFFGDLDLTGSMDAEEKYFDKELATFREFHRKWTDRSHDEWQD